MIALFDRDQRIDVEYPGPRREVTPNVIRHIDTSKNPEGMIIYSNLDEKNADAVISEQVNFFESIGQDFEWKVYDYDKPSDLKDRLAAHGFVIEELEKFGFERIAWIYPCRWTRKSRK